ncbi:hypothetical protein [Polaribacter cellanae]|uniref:Uncharacterized protein n=1 Tax=Polaribacter cellanae TaxID=2818493 RepID=A0A975CMT6_9FLAO|nr:hypothetical protein [Polaribacter cellanae]QTE22518.1 hypothetical protein J3359_17260 [Polaribacter cellanae]
MKDLDYGFSIETKKTGKINNRIHFDKVVKLLTVRLQEIKFILNGSFKIYI